LNKLNVVSAQASKLLTPSPENVHSGWPRSILAGFLPESIERGMGLKSVQNKFKKTLWPAL
jgi:hypothetical protein